MSNKIHLLSVENNHFNFLKDVSEDNLPCIECGEDIKNPLETMVLCKRCFDFHKPKGNKKRY